MKIFRKILRYWIAIASVLSFLGGWVILAHSPKPVQPQSAPRRSNRSPCPACLPSRLTAATTSNGLTFFSTPAPTNPPATNIQPIQPSQAMPMLRTRGS